MLGFASKVARRQVHVSSLFRTCRRSLQFEMGIGMRLVTAQTYTPVITYIYRLLPFCAIKVSGCFVLRQGACEGWRRRGGGGGGGDCGTVTGKARFRSARFFVYLRANGSFL